MIKVKFVKLSACPCGFPLLGAHVPLGTEYEIEPNIRTVLTLTCGGCGKSWQKPSIYVHTRGTSQGGFLPEEVFSHVAQQGNEAG